MYLGEIRLSWQSLLAATIGIGMGSALSFYTLAMFGPPLLAEFGWTKSQIALIGTLPLLTAPLVPFAGQFTDRFGVRVASGIGFAAMALGFLGFTVMSGSLIEYFAIYVVQQIFGMLTTSMVFCRVVVERFEKARGLALSIVMSGPPLVGALAAPLLGGLIRDEGWRAGYYALAALCVAGGLMSILLLGGKARQVAAKDPEVRLTWGEFFGLFRSPTLLLALGGMFLVNLSQNFSSQLKLIALDQGVSDSSATWLVSLYAMGVLGGRFIFGLSLDRIATHIVAGLALGLPTIGFLIFGGPVTALWILAAGVLTVGLAQGAEGDVGAFLISRRFDMKNYSLLLSLMMTMTVVGSTVGSIVMSITLRMYNDSYTPFLLFSAGATVVGALLFFLTGRHRPAAGGQAIMGEAIEAA